MHTVSRFHGTLLIVLASSVASLASTPFVPTTTLTAETSNNTSTAASFATQSNGNIGGANVSKQPMRSLLYPGSTARIYAHFVPWFGFGDHMNVGYTSNDPAQVQKQVADMLSRGFDGVVIDWYGRGTMYHNFVYYDQATQDMMHEAETHPGFTFAIMEDVGAIKACATTPGCDYVQMMVDDLNYANATYWNSPAYLLQNGRPVVYFFGEEAYTIDWNLVRSLVAGNPEFIFRNPAGFSDTQTSGAFSWVEPTIPGMTYLDGYYSTALTFPNSYSTGSAYKGFNDTLAAWGQNRIAAQNCGQTWLTSVAEAGKYYSASNQMYGMQLVTWNDYEEGTEIETGIDNCVTVNAAASGSVVSWAIAGQMNTVDHFSVYVSEDGQNLMWLADEATTTASLDLAPFALPAGNYIAFVKAVGKPSLTNKMSGGVEITLGAGTPGPSIAISAPSGSSQTIKAGQIATFALQVMVSGEPAIITVSCSGAPPQGACNAPSASFTVTPGTPAPVSVSVSTTANAVVRPISQNTKRPPARWPVASPRLILSTQTVGSMLSWGFLGALLFLLFSPKAKSQRPKATFALPVIVLAGLAIAGCAGGSLQSTPNSATPSGGTPSSTYTLTVTATSGNTTQSQKLTVTVQ